jgi:ABC-2 type transport system ATP-binding protein
MINKPKTAVKLESITKKYRINGFRTVRAVDALRLNIPENAVYGLLGPNGAGKTTTLRICCGLVKPTSGDVIICGHSIITETEEAKKCLGLLAQDTAFYADRTALDQLVFYAKLSGIKEPKQASVKMLEQVGLSERMNSKVETYSHGMVKLLNLAQAFISDPKVVFLDEPTSGLDPVFVHRIKKFILEEQKKRTIVISSHHLEAVEELCTHVAIINEGKLLVHGEMKKVRNGKSLESVFMRVVERA